MAAPANPADQKFSEGLSDPLLTRTAAAPYLVPQSIARRLAGWNRRDPSFAVGRGVFGVRYVSLGICWNVPADRWGRLPGRWHGFLRESTGRLGGECRIVLA